jgi:hypothetical protein
MNFTTFRMPWGQAQSLSDYQGICVKGGELLLSFVGAAQDAIKWPVETPPQGPTSGHGSARAACDEEAVVCIY